MKVHVDVILLSKMTKIKADFTLYDYAFIITTLLFFIVFFIFFCHLFVFCKNYSYLCPIVWLAHLWAAGGLIYKKDVFERLSL